MARNKNLGTVLVDMDGVLADFDGGIKRVIADERPEIVLCPKEVRCGNPRLDQRWPTRTHFYIAEDFPEEHREYINSIHDRPGFMAGLEPFHDAILAWQRLENLGYQPQICSSPLKSNPYSTQEKLEWLERHFVPRFGHQVVETAIINAFKSEYDAIALIDDKPEVRDAEQAKWVHILRSRIYNEHVVTDYRLDSWDGRQLPELLKLARQRYIDLGYLATQPFIQT